MSKCWSGLSSSSWRHRGHWDITYGRCSRLRLDVLRITRCRVNKGHNQIKCNSISQTLEHFQLRCMLYFLSFTFITSRWILIQNNRKYSAVTLKRCVHRHTHSGFRSISRQRCWSLPQGGSRSAASYFFLFLSASPFSLPFHPFWRPKS